MTLTAFGLGTQAARGIEQWADSARDPQRDRIHVYVVDDAAVDLRPYLYASGVKKATALFGISLTVAGFLLATDQIVAFALAAEVASFFGAVFLAVLGRYLLANPDGSRRTLRDRHRN